MKDIPEILLIGTGAVGSFYGGKLSQAGARVSTLCRSDYETVKNHGIKIKSTLGDFIFKPVQVIKSADECTIIPDYVIVATKVLPEIDVPQLIKKAIHPGTSIVLLQNGIDIEKTVAENFPDNEIISALAFICVSRINAGIIDHQDYGRIIIGSYPSGITDKTRILCSLLKKSGVQCDIDQDIISARWKKLVWNAPFNPISVLAGGADTRSMMESESTRILVEKVMQEVLDIAEQSHHPLERDVIKKNLDDTMVMKPYKTSMLLDYEQKRPMEVEAILGNAVRLAKKFNIEVPHIESLYGLLSLADKKNRVD